MLTDNIGAIKYTCTLTVSTKPGQQFHEFLPVDIIKADMQIFVMSGITNGYFASLTSNRKI